MASGKRKKKGTPKSPSKKVIVDRNARNLELPEGYQATTGSGSSHSMVLRGSSAKEKTKEESKGESKKNQPALSVKSVHSMALRGHESDDTPPSGGSSTERNNETTNKQRYDRSKFQSDVHEWLNQSRKKPMPSTQSPARTPPRRSRPDFKIDPSWPPEASYRESVKAWQQTHTARRYGLVQSRNELSERGFHPEVSASGPEKCIDDWLRRAESVYLSKPTREEYLLGTKKQFQGELLSYSRQLTRAPMIPRFNFMAENFIPCYNESPQSDTSRLFSALCHADIGPQIMDLVAEDGLETLHNLALTSRSMWQLMAGSMRIFDSVSGRFRTNGISGVVLATHPEYTIEDFQVCEIHDPLGANKWNSLSFTPRLKRWELYVLNKMFNEIPERSTPIPEEEERRPDIVSVAILNTEAFLSLDAKLQLALSRIPNRHTIWSSLQFHQSRPLQLYDPSYVVQVRSLHDLLKNVSERRNSIRVLLIHKVPMLDRRMLSIILRACPQLRMVGVYSCPMIHFGDVDCLLDLLHEINEERRGKLPCINSFDFHPAYEMGMPHQQEGYEATFGLLWSPAPQDIVQRGFFAILLKAALKARAMGLRLLFSKDHAFRDWMSKLPFTPLAIPSFLDALHRYLDLEGSTEVNERMEALFDLLKNVYQGLPKKQNRNASWYLQEMGMKHVHCSSCGYQNLEEFFDCSQMIQDVRMRLCAGCVLQHSLDAQRDHLKDEKLRLIDEFLDPNRNWVATKHNKKAPLCRSGLSLVHPYSGPRVDHSTLPPNAADPRWQLPGLVDHKVTRDSLQDLPSLDELMAGDKKANER